MSPRTQRVAQAILLAGALIAVLATFRDYGITWDEDVQSHYGELVLDYFRSGFRDQRCNTFLDLRFYGPLFEAASAAVYQTTGAPRFESRHLQNALLALLALPALMGLGRFFGDGSAGVWAALALLTLPRFYGDAFGNSKDVPFAVFFAWGIYGILRLLAHRLARWQDALLCGAAIGLAMAARVAGVVLFLYALAGGFVLLLLERRKAALPRPRAVLPMLGRALAVLAVAWLIMVLPWPWAHGGPLLRPLEAFGVLNRFPNKFPVLFEGSVFGSHALPRRYLAEYLLITTPPLHLLLLGLGGLVLARKAWSAQATPERLASLVVLLWLVLPLAYFVVRRPNTYDGLRHFLFLLPGMAMAVGLGAAAVASAVGARVRPLLAGALVAAALLLPVLELRRLHPYQSTYFNGLVGGVGGASGRYETDYWVSSYKEAMEWVNAQAAAVPGRPTRVLVAANSYSRACAEAYRGPDVEVSTVFKPGIEGPLPEPFDYYVATTRYAFSENYPDSPIVHAVSREGAVYTVIRRRVPTP